MKRLISLLLLILCTVTELTTFKRVLKKEEPVQNDQTERELAGEGQQQIGFSSTHHYVNPYLHPYMNPLMMGGMMGGMMNPYMMGGMGMMGGMMNPYMMSMMSMMNPYMMGMMNPYMMGMMNPLMMAGMSPALYGQHSVHHTVSSQDDEDRKLKKE
jgi:hypothetical protein